MVNLALKMLVYAKTVYSKLSNLQFCLICNLLPLSLSLSGITSICSHQGFSQDLETGCLKLAIVNFCGVKIFKGDHNILRFQP